MEYCSIRGKIITKQKRNHIELPHWPQVASKGIMLKTNLRDHILELEAMRSIVFEARLSTKLEVHYAPYKIFLNIEATGGQRS